MKLMKRTQIYQASSYNVIFNRSKMEAFSYKWWKFVSLVEGKVIFNNYFYSSTTGKHQRKVRSLMSDLGIKIDIEMPIAGGLQDRGDLSELILEAEEYLCNKYLEDILKKQDRYIKQKAKRFAKKLEYYLENEAKFRDYEIKPASQFGKYNKIAVHQVVSSASLEFDVNNAIHNFQRDGFGSIVFYVEGL